MSKGTNMFGHSNQPEISALEKEVQSIQHKHDLEVQRLKQEKELALKEKEFELRHFKDDELKKLQASIASKDQEIAVLRKENEMLEKITDLNADIIDIKDLVASLIGKLPEIKLNNLTLNGTSKE